MDVKLDLKDKKILCLLLKNARLPASTIARYVKLSKNAVLYRIERLLRNGVILRFLPILDYRKLGLTSYNMFIKLKATKDQETKIKEYFKSHSNVIWARTLLGKWNLFVQIIANDLQEFEDVLNEIILHIGSKLDSYDVKPTAKRIKIDHQLFDFKIDYKFRSARQDYSETFKLDGLDKKILVYLTTESAVASYSVIAKATGASLETVRNRMNKLLEAGVIVRYIPFVSYKALGLTRYLIIVNFRYLTRQLEEAVDTYINGIDKINLAFKTIGRPEMHFWIVSKGPDETEKIMGEIKNRFFDIIVDMEPILTTEEVTLKFFPKALERL